MRKIWIAILLLAFSLTINAQEGKQQYKMAVIGFYNLENLYDTVDNPIVNDEEFTPGGAKNYNGGIYLR